MISLTEKKHGSVVIVDDTLANLRVLSSLLERAGYEVRGASNGKTALMICKKRPPELILLDIRMPDMDGYEVCRQLHASETTQEIPVIFISALDTPEDKVKGFEVGGVDYITKPFQDTEVLARVKTHMQLHRSQLNLEQRTAELEAANLRLQELDKLKSMFIASMSHELRTPLNSIIGFSGVLLQGLSGDMNSEQKSIIERVYRAGNHLLGLISDVIDISKIEAGRIDAFYESFPLKDAIEEAIESIRPLADARGLELILDVDVWPQMNTDRKRLLQCVLNYLSNAVKFSETGKITLSVTVLEDIVEILVIDTGIGITEEDLPKLYEAFERLETHLRVKAGGTGLGLYLTKKITEELLHGSVSAQSHIDKGSTFGLRIPIDVVNVIQENANDR